MSAPVFLVDRDVLEQGAQVRVDGPEGRHAVSVRRLTVGESVVLSDGAGLVVDGIVAAVEPPGAFTVDVNARRTEEAPVPRIVVVQALPKGERGELAVSLLTEVGVDAIVPWAASRCIAQWRGDRGDKSWRKWRATARESGKQARRSWLPEIAPLASTADVVALIGRAADAVVLHEEATVPLAGRATPPRGDLVVIVGPEGGISPEERVLFEAAGAACVRLGPSVLRTSSAGAAAAAVVLASSGRWA